MIRELEFQLLCRRHRDEIYRYARGILGNQEDAEDATQEALLRLWNHLPRINLFHTRAWLYRTTRNYCLDQLNVNLPRFLLQDVVKELNGGPDDPLAKAGINLADLIKDIKLIRVVVIEAKEATRDDLDKAVAELRKTLESRWTPVATVPEDNVGVYALGDATGETMAGLAVLIHDKDDAVIANIVGRVSIGKIVKIASQMNKFPKDLLKKLMEAGGPEKAEKTEATESTEKAEKPPGEPEKRAAK